MVRVITLALELGQYQGKRNFSHPDNLQVRGAHYHI